MGGSWSLPGLPASPKNRFGWARTSRVRHSITFRLFVAPVAVTWSHMPKTLVAILPPNQTMTPTARHPRASYLTTLAILALLPATLALAEDFKTISGKLYKDARIIRVEADGIVVRTKSGIVKLYFSELPKEVQEGVQYDLAKATAASSPYQKTPMNVARPSALPAAIEKLQRQGLLRLDCGEPDAKAWISPMAWKRYDAWEKENLTKTLEAYCHPHSRSIWILDEHSGRKLASYDPFRGFKVY